MNRSLTELVSMVVGRFSGGAGVHHLMNPKRDWYLALILWAVVAFTVVSVSFYLFFLVDTGLSGTKDVSKEDVGVDRSLLKETLAFFEGEIAEYESLRQNPPSVPKPF